MVESVPVFSWRVGSGSISFAGGRIWINFLAGGRIGVIFFISGRIRIFGTVYFCGESDSNIFFFAVGRIILFLAERSDPDQFFRVGFIF